MSCSLHIVHIHNQHELIIEQWAFEYGLPFLIVRQMFSEYNR